MDDKVNRFQEVVLKICSVAMVVIPAIGNAVKLLIDKVKSIIRRLTNKSKNSD